MTRPHRAGPALGPAIALTLGFATSIASAGTVLIPFYRRPLPHEPEDFKLVRRDGTVDLSAINNVTGGGYYAEVGIGSPPQNISFLLDTGSSDTWVNSVDSDLCSSQTRQEKNGYCQPQFNPNSSSTFKVVDEGGFDITYLDGRRIRGDYFNDTVTISGKSVRNQQLGLALSSVRPSGIMGLGYSTNVAAGATYPAIVDSMVSQGIIDAPIYSLYLNDLQSKSGTILFGGVDSQKYRGKLATLPLVSESAASANITSFAVSLKSFSVGKTRLENKAGIRAILDSGSTLCLLPERQVREIYSRFGVRSFRGIDTPLVDCAFHSKKAKDVTFDFEFEGKTIKVPAREMAIDAFPQSAQDLLRQSELGDLFKDWDKICMFGIASSSNYGIASSRFTLLGDTFLRSAYVVYDMANHQLGLAEANVNSSKSNVVDVKPGSKNLPDVAGAEGSSNSSDSSAPGTAHPPAVAMLVAAVGLVMTLY